MNGRVTYEDLQRRFGGSNPLPGVKNPPPTVTYDPPVPYDNHQAPPQNTYGRNSSGWPSASIPNTGGAPGNMPT